MTGQGQRNDETAGEDSTWRRHLKAGREALRQRWRTGGAGGRPGAAPSAEEQARRQQWHAEAVGHFEEALREAEQFGPQDPHLVESLLQLSEAHTWPLGQPGGPERAEPLLRRALAIQEQTLGPEHPAVAGCLVRLAQLYTIQRRPPVGSRIMPGRNRCSAVRCRSWTGRPRRTRRSTGILSLSWQRPASIWGDMTRPRRFSAAPP